MLHYEVIYNSLPLCLSPFLWYVESAVHMADFASVKPKDGAKLSQHDG